MKLVGLANTRISTDYYAQKSPRSLPGRVVTWAIDRLYIKADQLFAYYGMSKLVARTH